jgi:hypothetical protein
LLLFPNPASKSVTVILPKQNSINELKIYNSLGQLMLSKQTLNQTSLSIDLSSFTKGIYLITLGELTTKFLIE